MFYHCGNEMSKIGGSLGVDECNIRGRETVKCTYFIQNFRTKTRHAKSGLLTAVLNPLCVIPVGVNWKTGHSPSRRSLFLAVSQS